MKEEKRPLTRRELRRRKRRRQVIRNRIILGGIALLLFVLLWIGCSFLIRWVVGLFGQGNTPPATNTDAEKTTQTQTLFEGDYPAGRLQAKVDWNGNPVAIGIGELDEEKRPLYAAKEGNRQVQDYTQLFLLAQTADGRFVAGTEENCLAYSFSVKFPSAEDERIIYEFVLKSGLKFADGETITGEDVLAAFQTVLGEEYNGPYQTKALSVNVESGHGLLLGKKECDDGVVRETLQVAAEQYVNDALECLNLPVASSKSGAGAGPYSVSAWNSDGTVVLTANEHFCLAVPKTQTVRLVSLPAEQKVSAVLDGTVDFVDSIADREQVLALQASTSENGIGWGNYSGNQIGYMGINAYEIPDINVRKALMSVLDPSLMKEAYPPEMLGLIDGCADADAWNYAPLEQIAYDETGEAAKQFLLASGYYEAAGVIGKDGVPLSFYFSIDGTLAVNPMGAVIDNARTILESIGCIVTISEREELLKEVAEGDRSCFFISRTVDELPDYFSLYYSGEEGANRSLGLGYLLASGTEEEKKTLKEINELILDDISESDYALKQAIGGKIQEKMASLALERPIYQLKECYMYRKDRIPEAWMTQNSLTKYRGMSGLIWNLE